jgi:hypothetical protein
MLKYLFILLGLITLYLSCAHARLNTYDFRQQILTDSLRIADSIHIADSTHVADSLTLLRYESSDRANRQKALHDTKRARADDSARKAFVPIQESEDDIVSSRSVVIPEGHEHAAAIDSVQRIIDSLYVELYQKDDHFKKMTKYPLDEKKRYFRYLIENRFKDTTQILTWCEMMYAMLNLEQAKMHLIIKTQQDENTRTFLMAHLKRTQEKLVGWSNLMVSLAASREKSLMKPVPTEPPGGARSE